MKPENDPISYEAFQAGMQRRKRGVWLGVLAAEPKERAVGRCSRSSLKE